MRPLLCRQGPRRRGLGPCRRGLGPNRKVIRRTDRLDSSLLDLIGQLFFTVGRRLYGAILPQTASASRVRRISENRNSDVVGLKLWRRGRTPDAYPCSLFIIMYFFFSAESFSRSFDVFGKVFTAAARSLCGVCFIRLVFFLNKLSLGFLCGVREGLCFFFFE